VLVSLGLDQHIKNLALSIDGPPQVDHLAVDFQIDLVEMPRRVRLLATLSQVGRKVVGTSTAWRQADALKDAGIDETYALQPLLNAVDTGEFRPDARTVLVVDEISQIGPRPMLRLLELQAETGMTINTKPL
jgi:hypothetical protein